jgi:hypothetical protein
MFPQRCGSQSPRQNGLRPGSLMVVAKKVGSTASGSRDWIVCTSHCAVDSSPPGGRRVPKNASATPPSTLAAIESVVARLTSGGWMSSGRLQVRPPSVDVTRRTRQCSSAYA